MEKEIKPIKDQIWYILTGHSIFIKNFIDKHTSTYLFNQLEKEVKYIPRNELKFLAPNGQNIPLPRIKQFYGTIDENGDYPIYKYSNDVYPKVLPWTPTLKIIKDLLENECNVILNHLVLNKYENENDYIGYNYLICII